MDLFVFGMLLFIVVLGCSVYDGWIISYRDSSSRGFYRSRMVEL